MDGETTSRVRRDRSTNRWTAIVIAAAIAIGIASWTTAGCTQLLGIEDVELGGSGGGNDGNCALDSGKLNRCVLK